MSRHNNPPDPAEVSAAPAPRRDPVTAMLSRKDFLLRLEQEMARALTRHRPLALALFEISPVSGMGNAEAQVLLRTLASRLWDSAQTEDTLGRLEDQLLAFILPGSGPFHALALAESVVSDVWAMCDDLENFPLKASVGASASQAQPCGGHSGCQARR